MKKIQTFRFALRPDPNQDVFFRQCAGACRFVYNRALALEIARHDAGEKRLGYVGTTALLPLWKREPETAWLSGIPSQILQQSLKDLDRAYRNFVEKRAGFPKFQRNDFLHKVSTTICKSHAVVVAEDLNVKGMSASAAGILLLFAIAASEARGRGGCQCFLTGDDLRSPLISWLSNVS